MIDVVVATGASIIDMDLFEALGFKHYKGRQDVPDVYKRQVMNTLGLGKPVPPVQIRIILTIIGGR